VITGAIGQFNQGRRIGKADGIPTLRQLETDGANRFGMGFTIPKLKVIVTCIQRQ
jgi:hypothetical protein